MPTIKRFEDINAWQSARRLANLIYKMTVRGEFSSDFALRDQIRRAAGSVMHNIAEGFDSGSDKEFARFLRYALRSVSEVQSQLYLALDQGYINQELFNDLYKMADETKSHLHGFVAYLVKSGAKKSFRELTAEYTVPDKFDPKTPGPQDPKTSRLQDKD